MHPPLAAPRLGMSWAPLLSAGRSGLCMGQVGWGRVGQPEMEVNQQQAEGRAGSERTKARSACDRAGTAHVPRREEDQAP